MDTRLLNKLTRFTEDEKIAFRKKAFIFSFFLFLAVIFWLMNALSGMYTANINYPVRFTDLPPGKVLIGEKSDYLTLKVNAHGYNIIRYRLSSRYIPISFSVDSYNLRTASGIDSSLFYVQTRFSREQLSRQLSSDFNILEILPDTLFFRFASIVTRKLPVKPDIDFEPDRLMILMGVPVCKPDSVLISGPDYIVDTLQVIYTRQKKLGILSKSYDGNIYLNKPDNIDMKADKVNVYVGVERITEKVLSVPLEVINIPDELTIKTFPSFIEVSCQVGLSAFPVVKPENFRLIADFEESSSGTVKLSVKLGKSPENVRLVKFSPKNVEYLIEK